MSAIPTIDDWAAAERAVATALIAVECADMQIEHSPLPTITRPVPSSDRYLDAVERAAIALGQARFIAQQELELATEESTP